MFAGEAGGGDDEEWEGGDECHHCRAVFLHGFESVYALRVGGEESSNDGSDLCYHCRGGDGEDDDKGD